MAWSQIECPENERPTARSGHTTVVFGKKMYIFGGILELTHELNDLVIFDTETCKFSSNSETAAEDEESANKGFAEEKSPTLKHGTIASPMKRGKTLVVTQSPSRSPTKKRQSSPGATKKDDNSGNRDGLSSPTSVSMLNSFIIKNADESFETNSKLISKKSTKAAQHVEKDTVKFTTFVEGNKPTPRDGHSACVDSNGFMYVFGGDRHHMPFNDLYMIKLE